MSQNKLSTKLTETLSDELKQLENRDRELLDKIAEFQRERSEIKNLITAMQTLMGNAQDNVDPKLGNIKARNHAQKDDPLEIAVEVLRERHSQDMHYKALAAEIVHRGGRLPKPEPWWHLNSLMNQDARFIRPHRRGYYALKEDYPQLQRSVGERRRKRTSKPETNEGN